MAKKRQGAKKLLNSRLNKLKYLSKKYELIKDIAPREYVAKPITVNNRKFKSKYEAELYIKSEKADILAKLQKTKSYSNFIHQKQTKGGEIGESYSIELARYWEREKIEDFINDTEEVQIINGMNKDTNMHGIHSLLDTLFSMLDSSSAIGINIGEDGKCTLYIQISEKVKSKK